MSQKALFLETKQGHCDVRDRSIPAFKPEQILVRVEAAALNPVDWKIQKYGVILTEFPAILGYDGAGIVQEIGSDVTSFSKGDRVLFQRDVLNYDTATFQQYVVLESSLVAKVPDRISLEAAATVPLGLATAATGLYVAKGSVGGAEIQPPWAGGSGKYVNQPFVVIGGSSSVGLYVIQLAKLAGFSPIISTASLRNESLLKSLGVTHVVDRNTPLTGSVRSITSAPVNYIYDTISLEETQKAAWDLLGAEGTLVTTLDAVVKPAPGEKKTVCHTWALLTLPNTKSVGVGLYENITQWLEDGLIVPNPLEVLSNGLAGVPAGLKLLEENKVSGKKLVVRPHDTA